MQYLCPQYRNRFSPFWSFLWLSRRITFRFSTDGSLKYTADEFNDRTGPQWGMKFFYITTLFGQHRNSVNWSLTHLDGMVLNAYWYRDSVLQDKPVLTVVPNQKYTLTIDATGGMVRWIVDGKEVHRIEGWRPRINWIFSPFYGKSGVAVAPHEMKFNSALCRERK